MNKYHKTWLGSDGEENIVLDQDQTWELVSKLGDVKTISYK